VFILRRRSALRNDHDGGCSWAALPEVRAWAQAVAWCCAGLLALSLFGCAPAIWRGYRFEQVFQDAKRDNRVTLVYLRTWSSVECTRFEDGVLNTPAVRAAVKDVYCVALEILVDEKLAERWNVAGPPAVVLISSSGEVLSRLSGEITAAQLIDAVQRALAGRQETP